jgi:signal transduction histidine kinase
LFLIFKECLHNASRHSGCTLVTASLEAVDQEVRLTVEDNGHGFSPEDAATERRGGGNGIPNIRRRAEALGGRVEIRSTPGEGSAVRVIAPVKRFRFASYRFE